MSDMIKHSPLCPDHHQNAEVDAAVEHDRIFAQEQAHLSATCQTLQDMEEKLESRIGAIAEKAASKKTGARGLRSIVEEILTDIMYEIPSRNDVKKVIITKSCVEGGEPTLVLAEPKAEDDKIS